MVGTASSLDTTQSCAGAVSSSQLAVRSTAQQRAPPRLLPALSSPALQHTSNSASRQKCATTSSVRLAGSLTDSCHSLADTGGPARAGGMEGASSGTAPSSSGNSCGSTGAEVEACSGLAASLLNPSNCMSGGLGGRQERSMGGCEAALVSSSTSAGQVHKFLLFKLHVVLSRVILSTRLISHALCFPLLGHLATWL